MAHVLTPIGPIFDIDSVGHFHPPSVIHRHPVMLTRTVPHNSTDTTNQHGSGPAAAIRSDAISSGGNFSTVHIRRSPTVSVQPSNAYR